MAPPGGDRDSETCPCELFALEREMRMFVPRSEFYFSTKLYHSAETSEGTPGCLTQETVCKGRKFAFQELQRSSPDLLSVLQAFSKLYLG